VHLGRVPDVGKKTLLKLPVTVSGIFSQSTITSGKLFLQSFPEVIRTVRFLLQKKIVLSRYENLSHAPLLVVNDVGQR
jgi:hypothetical protein